MSCNIKKIDLDCILIEHTFRPIQFTLKINGVVEDLTNYEIECKFRRSSKIGEEVKYLTIDNGITLTDAVNGVFVIDEFVLDKNFTPANYYFDVKFIKDETEIDTYIEGILPVVQNVTY